MHRVTLSSLLALALTLFLATAAAAQNYDMEYAELSIGQTNQFHHDTGGAVITEANPQQPGGPRWFLDAVDSTLHSVAQFAIWDDGSGRIEETNQGAAEGIFQFLASPTDPHDGFYLDVMFGTHSRNRLIMLGHLRPPPPPPPTLKVSMTAPHNGDTVSGTNWVVLWVSGTSGSSNVFSLSIDGKAIGTPQTTSSTGPVTLPWPTSSVPNGTHTLTGSVRDAAGNTGSVSISVIVKN